VTENLVLPKQEGAAPLTGLPLAGPRVRQRPEACCCSETLSDTRFPTRSTSPGCPWP